MIHFPGSARRRSAGYGTPTKQLFALETANDAKCDRKLML